MDYIFGYRIQTPTVEGEFKLISEKNLTLSLMASNITTIDRFGM